ncbi:vegetative cell wall protein gp1-like [Zingiber officinale]|uniref:vegetative cell wall protein gp1-like n=1 Tax=Zingiber officinale TaxID=94328 RepID=UPI001C4D06EF|nr:vegetative cell wall protein gp1-like [Zingiber officinale]
MIVRTGMLPLLLGTELGCLTMNLIRMTSHCLRDFAVGLPTLVRIQALPLFLLRLLLQPPLPLHDESDSDDEPLSQRLRRRAPDLSQDSGPSTVPPPSSATTTTSPSPPMATQIPVPDQAYAPPAPPEVQVEPSSARPSTSQQHYITEASPSLRPSPATSPPEPSPVPPSVPSGSAAGPSGSAAGPSQPPPPVPHFYRTTTPSEVGLQS